MKCGRPVGTDRVGGCEAKLDPNGSTSTPDLCVVRPRRVREKPASELPRRTPRDGYSTSERRTPRDGHSASEYNLSARQNDPAVEDLIPIEPKSVARGDVRSPIKVMELPSSSNMQYDEQGPYSRGRVPRQTPRRNIRQEKLKPTLHTSFKKPKLYDMMSTTSPVESETTLLRQIREVHKDMRSSTRIIKDSRNRLLELQKKMTLSEADVKELNDRHELLLREMERFDRLTRTVQRLVDYEISSLRKTREPAYPSSLCAPNIGYEPSVYYHEMKMTHPTAVLGSMQPSGYPSNGLPENTGRDATRSKSEIDLTRKLSESYDMQEKLVADNADLEVKRYILYKELMTKDQNLETCRAQIKRLQGELKLMSKENAALHEIIARNCPEGDASSLNYESKFDENQQVKTLDTYTISKQSLDTNCEENPKLVTFKSSNTDFESQLQSLETELREMKDNIQELKKLAEDTSRAGAGPHSCPPVPCIPPKPPTPPPKTGLPCNVCPPCPAPCNTKDPPSALDREVARLSIQLRSVEDNLKAKITENAILRADLSRIRENLEKEKTAQKEATAKLKEAETKIESMAEHHNMMMGTKEASAEMFVNIRALKQCYREAREEVDELRQLLREQNEQLQSYRNKYMQSMQTVEEQKRHLEVMDMDNNRISEQINLEIQKIKNNFQEKMSELGPLTESLKQTKARLDESLQSQAMAEHKAEELAKELTTARERIHILLYNMMKPPPKTEVAGQDKVFEALQARVLQLTKQNSKLIGDCEQLKAKIIRLEESGVVYEQRLQDKMQECACLGGELDNLREETSRALARANERIETMRMTMQLNKSDLEKTLAAERAKLHYTEKDREELKCRLSCQIKRLRENYDQAQLRILALTTQIAVLRQGNAAASSSGDGDEDSVEECLCGVSLK